MQVTSLRLYAICAWRDRNAKIANSIAMQSMRPEKTAGPCLLTVLSIAMVMRVVESSCWKSPMADMNVLRSVYSSLHGVPVSHFGGAVLLSQLMPHMNCTSSRECSIPEPAMPMIVATYADKGAGAAVVNSQAQQCGLMASGGGAHVYM
jgi:hypothetical protein